MNAGEVLAKASETHAKKNQEYGDNYIRAGKAMEALFPKGLILKSMRDQTRYHLFSWIIGKLARYAVNWENGHKDSIHDACVYAALLEAFDEKKEEEDTHKP